MSKPVVTITSLDTYGRKLLRVVNYNEGRSASLIQLDDRNSDGVIRERCVEVSLTMSELSALVKLLS